MAIILEGDDGEVRIIADEDILYAEPIGEDVDLTSFDKVTANPYLYYKY